MRRHDWSGFVALGAFLFALLQLVRGQLASSLAALAVVAVAGMLTRRWSLEHPGPMPHLLRWTLLVPRGNQSPRHLERILGPCAGERLLEVGPGIGIHAVAVARSLGPDGTLDVVDVQQTMLDDVLRRARVSGVGNITARQGDAERLPYADGTFDGAYLVGVLGEIPDGQAALRELRRVLKRDGRLVVGEVFFDPDFVSFASLRARAEAASFAFERRLGGALSYLARFSPK